MQSFSPASTAPNIPATTQAFTSSAPAPPPPPPPPPKSFSSISTALSSTSPSSNIAQNSSEQISTSLFSTSPPSPKATSAITSPTPKSSSIGANHASAAALADKWKSINLIPPGAESPSEPASKVVETKEKTKISAPTKAPKSPTKAVLKQTVIDMSEVTKELRELHRAAADAAAAKKASIESDLTSAEMKREHEHLESLASALQSQLHILDSHTQGLRESNREIADAILSHKRELRMLQEERKAELEAAEKARLEAEQLRLQQLEAEQSPPPADPFAVCGDDMDEQDELDEDEAFDDDTLSKSGRKLGFPEAQIMPTKIQKGEAAAEAVDSSFKRVFGCSMYSHWTGSLTLEMVRLGVPLTLWALEMVKRGFVALDRFANEGYEMNIAATSTPASPPAEYSGRNETTYPPPTPAPPSPAPIGEN
eukprot:CAMPEP_0167745940 /NCGR_PEP_ID=MMETSP0110_2-20121227/3429_1 /TAXON_ID=629695 /ORGANISM="Gymnochlora sp., Strain CCMP2014" /LENGTH=424 /DNA_ID=CAMNT_0007630635 /DNA_START=738 /DNA_END=2012 /DNA_ORIENTATION=-